MTNRQQPVALETPREGTGGKRVKVVLPQESSREAELKDLVGKVVDIPAKHFGVDVPEMFYRATILRRDTARRAAVVVRFHEDSSLYWLPMEDVQRWLSATCPNRSGCTGKAADEFAAAVLLDIRHQSLKFSGIAS